LAACGGSPLNLYNAIFIFGITAFFVSKFFEKINLPEWMALGALTTGIGIFAVSAYIDVKYLSDIYFDQTITPNRSAKMITHFLYAVSGCWIILGASLLSWRPKNAIGRAFTYLGEASFSLYLIHEPALGVMARILHPLTLDGSPRGEFAVFVIVGSSIVLALAVHQYIELRLVDLFRASSKRG
jgi:peptidoglycan/LPS O-acetylase OafA/YrhL